MTKAELAILDAIIEHALELNRVTAGIADEVLAELVKLRRNLVAHVATIEQRAMLNSVLSIARANISASYSLIAQMMESRMRKIAEIEQSFITRTLGQNLSATITPLSGELAATLVSDVMISGSPMAGWWEKQGLDTAFRFAAGIRQGMANGETVSQLIKRVRGTSTTTGILDVSARSARTLVQSSVASVSNAARMASFQQNSELIKGVEQVSTLDSHTSDICIAYSGGKWDLKGKPIMGTKLPFNGGPPRHPNCRSVLKPITKSYRELGLDIDEIGEGTRASVDGQIKSGITFAQFLEGKSEQFQDKLLGKGKARMWREGKITLQQLLDQRGNPQTLQQLEAKYK